MVLGSAVRCQEDMQPVPRVSCSNTNSLFVLCPEKPVTPLTLSRPFPLSHMHKQQRLRETHVHLFD